MMLAILVLTIPCFLVPKACEVTKQQVQVLEKTDATADQLKKETNTTAGRFLIYPLTMYGPNVQLLGLLHAVAICKHLGVQCVEPGFSDLFVEHTYQLDDFLDLDSSNVNLLPRSALPSPLKPSVFFYGTINKHQIRWPTPQYFQMHNISYLPEPSKEPLKEGEYYARTVQCASQLQNPLVNTESTLKALQNDIIWFQQQQVLPSSSNSDHIVALVYSATLGTAIRPPPPPLTEAFSEARRLLRPSKALHQEAQRVTQALFPGDTAPFIAMHLRLLDHCKTTIKECCCETSGSKVELTTSNIEAFAEMQMRKLGTRNLFISGPPALERMVPEWDWFVANNATVKLWYSPTAPGSLEESMVQQLICSKASAFFASVPSSTWAGSVTAWQPPSATANSAPIIIPLPVPKSTKTFSRYTVGPEHQHDTHRDLSYLPTNLVKVNDDEVRFLLELDNRLERAASRTTCSQISTMFAMLRNDGFGASYHFMHLALGVAISHGMPLVPMNENPGGKWIWGEACKSNDWTCLFKPTHNCPNNNSPDSDTMHQVEIQDVWNNGQPCPAPWCMAWKRADFNFDLMEPLSLGIPEHGVSSVLYRARLSKFLFRLNSKVKEEVGLRDFVYLPSQPQAGVDGTPTDHGSRKTVHDLIPLKEILSLFLARGTDDPPIIALHVRHGDSSKDPRKIRRCFNLVEYMEAASKMKRLYKADTIMLATDSAEVVANATAHYPQ